MRGGEEDGRNVGEQGGEDKGVENRRSERLELSDRLCCIFVEVEKVNRGNADGSGFDGCLRSRGSRSRSCSRTGDDRIESTLLRIFRRFLQQGFFFGKSNLELTSSTSLGGFLSSRPLGTKDKGR